MARSRNIKPGFFQNDEIADLHPLERLAFIGMWTIADFKGCIEYRPKMLKVQILPYDECDMEVITNNLEQARFIRSYSVQGKRYLKIVNFEKHQNPHKNEREAGSEIPDIGEKDEIDNKNSDLSKDGTKTDLIGTDRADSLLLIPDSLNLIPDSKKSEPASADSFPLVKKQKVTSPQGARLPQDWFVSADLAAWTTNEAPGIDIRLEEEKFRDFWHAKAGKDAAKLDWDATWRNWIRRARGQNNGSAHQQDTRSRAKRFADKCDEIARRDIEQHGFADTLD